MPDIEYFYSAHSAYAYLGARQLQGLAERCERRILHRPMDLARVVRHNSTAPTNGLTPARRAYFSGREIQRWAELRGQPILDRFPTHHQADPALANCMLIAAGPTGPDVDRLSLALLQAHWRDDADLSDATTLQDLAAGLGLDGTALLASAAGEAVHLAYAANTEEAMRRAVFGSPTYFVDGDMFYGQDRLELVERAIGQPFQGRWSWPPPPI